jgi:L-arabinonolactonase
MTSLHDRGALADMPLEAELLVACDTELGEGVQWHPRHRRVFWTDIKASVLWSCDEHGGRVRRLDLEAPLCSFAFCDDGRMLAAFADGLAWVDPLTGRRRLFEPYQPDRPGTRMNDGALDRQGRFVVGGIDEADRQPVTPVWSVDRGRVREILHNVVIANSTAFSPDGTVMYFADTPEGVIRAYAYNPATGTPSQRRDFAVLAPDEGKPDGSTVDAQGALWNARFGGGSVARYLPDGTPDLVVRVPTPNVTCCALGGRTMRRLFITTARIEMTEDALAAAPHAGGLFVVDVPVRGLVPGTYRR